jgi:hypothetical protein
LLRCGDVRIWGPKPTFAPVPKNVGFSSRPFGVKRFQTIHHQSVDVSRGLVLFCRLKPLRQRAAMSDDTAPTLFLLMAQYNGRTVVPLDEVCRDFSVT